MGTVENEPCKPPVGYMEDLDHLLEAMNGDAALRAWWLGTKLPRIGFTVEFHGEVPGSVVRMKRRRRELEVDFHSLTDQTFEHPLAHVDMQVLMTAVRERFRLPEPPLKRG
jgi:hypothetical protein